MTKYQFPAAYGQNCVLVPIDAALVPLISGALMKFQSEYVWQTSDDWELGYNAFAELQANLMNSCLRELVESNNRLYRLLDTALNGTIYAAEAPDPVTGDQVVTPPIPAAPPQLWPTSPAAMRAQLRRLHQLAENAATGAEYPANGAVDGTPALDFDGSWRARLEAVQGQINAGWFGIGGQPATLADLVAALRIGNPQDAAQIDTVLEALSASSSTANVFSAVRGLLGDTVDAGLEGATLGTLIAASLANAATQGILSGQLDQLAQRLDRVAAALDGGTVPAPSNVITELEAIKTMVS